MGGNRLVFTKEGMRPWGFLGLCPGSSAVLTFSSVAGGEHEMTKFVEDPKLSEDFKDFQKTSLHIGWIGNKILTTNMLMGVR